jgi:hypothetical protein
MTIGIRDANEVNLLAASGIALTAGNGGDAGAWTALDADATDVTFVLTLNTSGTTTSTIEMQVSSDADGDVRSLGTFDVIDAATDDAEVRYLDAFIPGYPGEVGGGPAGTSRINAGGARYVRAFVTTGASAVLTGSTLYTRIAKFNANLSTRTA